MCGPVGRTTCVCFHLQGSAADWGLILSPSHLTPNGEREAEKIGRVKETSKGMNIKEQDRPMQTAEVSSTELHVVALPLFLHRYIDSS